jgi:hypothetical protein
MSIRKANSNVSISNGGQSLLFLCDVSVTYIGFFFLLDLLELLERERKQGVTF